MQGAFILVGSNSIGNGLLIVMGACIALYAAWRFWEGITGQGHDSLNSKGLNFFRYRLSPIVSGGVYTLYAVFVLTLLPKDSEQKQDQAKNSAFPDSWAHSGIGKTGLCLAGIAFVAGVPPVLGLTALHHPCSTPHSYQMPVKARASSNMPRPCLVLLHAPCQAPRTATHFTLPVSNRAGCADVRRTFLRPACISPGMTSCPSQAPICSPTCPAPSPEARVVCSVPGADRGRADHQLSRDAEAQGGGA